MTKIEDNINNSKSLPISRSASPVQKESKSFLFQSKSGQIIPDTKTEAINFDEKLLKKKKSSPYENASPFSILTFRFANKIINAVWKRGFLLSSDIYPITDDLDTLVQANRIESVWNNQIKQGKEPDLFDTVLRSYKTFFIMNSLLVCCEGISKVLKCAVLYKLLNAMNGTINFNCYIYAVGLVFVVFLQAVVYNLFTYRSIRMGVKLRTSLTTFIYKNMLNLRLSANYSSGEILSLVSNDLQKFDDAAVYIPYIYTPFFELILIFVCYYTLFSTKSLSFLFSFVGMLIQIPLQLLLSTLFGKIKRKMIPIKDEITKTLADMLTGIQVLKYFAWEDPFSQRLLSIRKKGTNYLRKCFVSKGFNLGLYYSASIICTTVYAICEYLKGRGINSADIFAVSSLLDVFGHSFGLSMPRAIETRTEARMASKRVSMFLLKSCEQNSCLNVVEEMPNSLALKIENATLIWPESDGQLAESSSYDAYLSTMKIPVKKTTFEIKKGEFCMIMGPVGCGKSALLYSIMGELQLIGGEITHSGKISFVPQSPWLIAGNVKENILFGRQFDRDLYNRVIKVSCLDIDLKAFEKGDLTFLSDKGTSLSGGQRSRISLARALYAINDADLFLLDDVLSAVDNKVGNLIFKALKQFLVGKTCLFISHQLHFAKYCDKIMLLSGGNMKYFGSYQSLIEKKGLEFVKTLVSFDPQADQHSQAATIPGYTSKRNSINDIVDDQQQQQFTNVFATSTIDINEFQIKEENSSAKTENSSGNEEEDALKENYRTNVSSKSFFRFLLRGGGVAFVLFVLLLCLFAQLLFVFHGFWLSKWTEVLGNPGSTDPKFYPIVLCCIALGCIVTLIGRSVGVLMLCVKSSDKLFSLALSGLLNTDMLFFQQNPQGKVLNRLTKDQSLTDENLPLMFLDATQCILMASGIFLSCILVTPWILLGIPLVIGPSLFYRRKFLKASSEIKKIESCSRSPIYSLLASSLSGLVSIRCFGCEGRFLKRFVDYQNFNTSAMHSFIFTSRWFALRADILSVLFLASFTTVLLLHKGISSANPGTKAVSVGTGFALTKCCSLLGLMQWCFRAVAEVVTLLTSFDRVDEYRCLPPEEPLFAASNGVMISDPSSSVLVGENWPERGKVEFNGVFLKYPASSVAVLNNITLTLEPSQKIAVVGRTGAGKSSLISAIFRILEPTPSGSLLIDDVDICKLRLKLLRSRIGIILQEPFLFKGTIRFNLDPFQQYTDHQIWDALEPSEMHQTIYNLPEQLDLIVQEGGSNFSVGERQLLCLSRAILRKPKVIIMDEATANIDMETTEKIITAMAVSFSQSTVITIAHRLQTVLEYDKILVLDKGQVAEFDAPYTLLCNESSYFRSMANEIGSDAIKGMIEVAALSAAKKAALPKSS